MNKEYIEREVLYELAYWHGKLPDFNNPYPEGAEAVDVSDIDNIPNADVVAIKRGEWIKSKWGYPDRTLTCSYCSFEHEIPSYNYCPNCGAKMGSEQCNE